MYDEVLIAAEVMTAVMNRLRMPVGTLSYIAVLSSNRSVANYNMSLPVSFVESVMFYWIPDYPDQYLKRKVTIHVNAETGKLDFEVDTASVVVKASQKSRMAQLSAIRDNLN